MIGTVEKYTGRNLAAMVVPYMADDDVSISSTYRHRILFGYAMALAFPLTLALRKAATTKWQRFLLEAAFLLLPAACYFSNSRGPWVGCALAGVMMLVLGDRVVRRKLRLASILVAAVLIMRPGVLETIQDLWRDTFDDSSVKGKSASYRKELWRVAYKNLDKSGRMLIGFGGHSTESMDLSDDFEHGAGGRADQLGYTSWDSEYAADFMKFGLLGLVLEACLYVTIFRMVINSWRFSSGDDRRIAAACAATCAVFLWAMSTVAIFNAQLEFFFWSVIAIAGKLQAIGQAAGSERVRSEDREVLVEGIGSTAPRMFMPEEQLLSFDK
jgi:O-antigen ligase